MPVRQRENKWYWGSKGPFTSRKKAEKVAQAAYASGYVSKLFDFTKQVPPKSEGEVPDFTKPLDDKIKPLGTNVPEEFREYLAGKKPPKGAKILIGARGKTFYDTRTLQRAKTDKETQHDEFEKKYAALAKKTSDAEKTPSRRMAPEETALMQQDWKAYSRSRGYTEEEIADFEKFINMTTEGVEKYGYSMDDLHVMAREAVKAQPKVPEASLENQKIAEENDRLNDTLPDEDVRTTSQSKIGKDLEKFWKYSPKSRRFYEKQPRPMTAETHYAIFDVYLGSRDKSVDDAVQEINYILAGEFQNDPDYSEESRKRFYGSNYDEWADKYVREPTGARRTEYSRKDIIEFAQDIQRRARYLTKDLGETLTVYRGNEYSKRQEEDKEARFGAGGLGTGLGKSVSVSLTRKVAESFAGLGTIDLTVGQVQTMGNLHTMTINRADILADVRGGKYDEKELIIPTQVLKKNSKSTLVIKNKEGKIVEMEKTIQKALQNEDSWADHIARMNPDWPTYDSDYAKQHHAMLRDYRNYKLHPKDVKKLYYDEKREIDLALGKYRAGEEQEATKTSQAIYEEEYKKSLKRLNKSSSSGNISQLLDHVILQSRYLLKQDPPEKPKLPIDFPLSGGDEYSPMRAQQSGDTAHRLPASQLPQTARQLEAAKIPPERRMYFKGKPPEGIDPEEDVYPGIDDETATFYDSDKLDSKKHSDHLNTLISDTAKELRTLMKMEGDRLLTPTGMYRYGSENIYIKLELTQEEYDLRAQDLRDKAAAQWTENFVGNPEWKKLHEKVISEDPEIRRLTKQINEMLEDPSKFIHTDKEKSATEMRHRIYDLHNKLATLLVQDMRDLTVDGEKINTNPNLDILDSAKWEVAFVEGITDIRRIGKSPETLKQELSKQIDAWRRKIAAPTDSPYTFDTTKISSAIQDLRTTLEGVTAIHRGVEGKSTLAFTPTLWKNMYFRNHTPKTRPFNARLVVAHELFHSGSVSPDKTNYYENFATGRIQDADWGRHSSLYDPKQGEWKRWEKPRNMSNKEWDNHQVNKTIGNLRLMFEEYPTEILSERAVAQKYMPDATDVDGGERWNRKDGNYDDWMTGYTTKGLYPFSKWILGYTGSTKEAISLLKDFRNGNFNNVNDHMIHSWGDYAEKYGKKYNKNDRIQDQHNVHLGLKMSPEQAGTGKQMEWHVEVTDQATWRDARKLVLGK